MKQLLMAILLGFGLIASPSLSFAAPADAELEAYLQEIGWTQAELEEYLDFDGWVLADFVDMQELRDYLGEVLTSENLPLVLASYELTEEEATALLVEYGELEVGQTILEVYTFVNDLDFDLYYYQLTPIDAENLEALLQAYGLTLDELNELLLANEDSLENYEFIEDLDFAVDYYLNGPEIDFSELEALFSDIGLTTEELEALVGHLMNLNVEDPAFLEKLDELSNRMMAFEEIQDATELTEEQKAEILAVFNELLNLFEIDAAYYLVKDGVKTAKTLEELAAMENLNGYGLSIELFNIQGERLADLFLTAEMLGTDLIVDTGKDLDNTGDIIENQPLPKTEKGGLLPKTASGYIPNALAGLLLAGVGILFFRRMNWKNV